MFRLRKCFRSVGQSHFLLHQCFRLLQQFKIPPAERRIACSEPVTQLLKFRLPILQLSLATAQFGVRSLSQVEQRSQCRFLLRKIALSLFRRSKRPGILFGSVRQMSLLVCQSLAPSISLL